MSPTDCCEETRRLSIARRFGSAIISNADCTRLIYFITHIRVKVYFKRPVVVPQLPKQARVGHHFTPHPPFCGSLFCLRLRESLARSLDQKGLDIKVSPRASFSLLHASNGGLHGPPRGLGPRRF